MMLEYKITASVQQGRKPKAVANQSEVSFDASKNKIINWHKNILKFGTITNTVNRACKFEGEMVKQNNEQLR